MADPKTVPTVAVKATADFDYTLDGRDVRPVKAGDKLEVHEAHYAGLYNMRLVEPADEKKHADAMAATEVALAGTFGNLPPAGAQTPAAQPKPAARGE